MVRKRAAHLAALCMAGLLLAACAPKPEPPPPPPPPPPPVVSGPTQVSERTLLTMASDQTFPSGGYTLTATGRKKLDEILPALPSLPRGASTPKW